MAEPPRLPTAEKGAKKLEKQALLVQRLKKKIAGLEKKKNKDQEKSESFAAETVTSKNDDSSDSK